MNCGGSTLPTRRPREKRRPAIPLTMSSRPDHSVRNLPSSIRITTSKTRFILNPCSGHIRRRPGLVTAIRAFIAKHGLDADLALTERRGQATDLARAAVAQGYERVVAVGGDGTMNEVGRALVDQPAVLALVPCGSGNGLARHLGIPTQPRRALALLVDPAARAVRIDTGLANGHPFFNAAGAGFDAEISRRFNQLERRGLAAYLRTGVAAFADHRGESVTLSDGEGHQETINAFFVMVANSEQYGNHARVAPGACVDDGLLDLVAVRTPSVAEAVVLLGRLFLGTFHRSRHVLHWRSARFVIERPAAGLIHTDGETHDTGATLEIVVRPQSLRLLVPTACVVAADA
jgi:YegS/Rv2252/BmrU family lipid kinase